MSNKILVDKGALNIALSALKRRGVNEIEQELRLSCEEYIDPLEAVRAEIEDAMLGYRGKKRFGAEDQRCYDLAHDCLKFAIDAIDKAKGVKGG